MTMLAKTALVGLSAALCIGAAAACSTDSADTATTPCATTATVAPGTAPALVAAAKAAKVPEGVAVVGVQSVSNVEDRRDIDAIVRVCSPGLVGDELKDVATSIAQAVKASPVGSTVASMRVTNTAEDSNPKGRVRCEDFGLHTFSSEADAGAVRASWSFADS